MCSHKTGREKGGLIEKKICWGHQPAIHTNPKSEYIKRMQLHQYNNEISNNKVFEKVMCACVCVYERDNVIFQRSIAFYFPSECIYYIQNYVRNY